MTTAEIVTEVGDAERTHYSVRYQKGNWTFCIHDDPGLDFVINPQGFTCTGIWDPMGPYSHPNVPAELFTEFDELLTNGR